MKKIISLFQRNYDGDGLARDEVVPGAEWVLAGDGVPTEKLDGTCCMVRDGQFFKRYDRKLTKAARKRRDSDGTSNGRPWGDEDFKPAPDGWISAEAEPNRHTGHWPGWMPVGDGPEDQWHRAAWDEVDGQLCSETGQLPNGTYELVGPKVQGNPYELQAHHLASHGLGRDMTDAPRDFDGLRAYLEHAYAEGIVWHHPDGRMVKIKRRDFGWPWPVKP